jgi:hypothetical protein
MFRPRWIVPGLDYALNVFQRNVSDWFAWARLSVIILSMGEPTPLLCHRCGCDLRPGEGNFFVVRIETWADPTPPNITSEDLAADVSAKIDKLIEQMRGMSEQELMDQVYRRLTIHLCGACYKTWIENPTG